jgi:hypothetical protein
LLVLPPASLKTRPLFSLWFPVLIIRRLMPQRFGRWFRRLKAGRSARLSGYGLPVPVAKPPGKA